MLAREVCGVWAALLPRMQALPGAIELPRQHGGLLVVLGDKIARDVPDRS